MPFVSSIAFVFFTKELQNYFYVLCTSVEYLVSDEMTMGLYLEAKWKFSTIESSLQPCHLVPGSIFYINCNLFNFLWGSSFCPNRVAIHIYHLLWLLPSKTAVSIQFIFKYLLHSADIKFLCQIWEFSCLAV